MGTIEETDFNDRYEKEILYREIQIHHLFNHYDIILQSEFVLSPSGDGCEGRIIIFK
jgi:hypothetical protein